MRLQWYKLTFARLSVPLLFNNCACSSREERKERKNLLVHWWNCVKVYNIPSTTVFMERLSLFLLFSVSNVKPFLLQWAHFLLYIHSSPLKICIALHEDFCNTSHFCCPNLLLEACKQKRFSCPCSHIVHLLPPNIDLTPASLFFWSGFLHEPYSTPQQCRVPKVSLFPIMQL